MTSFSYVSWLEMISCPISQVYPFVKVLWMPLSSSIRIYFLLWVDTWQMEKEDFWDQMSMYSSRSYPRQRRHFSISMRKMLSSMKREESRMNKEIKRESTMKLRKRNKNKTKQQMLLMNQSDGEMNKRENLFLLMKKRWPLLNLNKWLKTKFLKEKIFLKRRNKSLLLRSLKQL